MITIMSNCLLPRKVFIPTVEMPEQHWCFIIFDHKQHYQTAKDWNTPKYRLNRWLSHKVHHRATILRFSSTIWFVQYLYFKDKSKCFMIRSGTLHRGQYPPHSNQCRQFRPLESWSRQRSWKFLTIYRESNSPDWSSQNSVTHFSQGAGRELGNFKSGRYGQSWPAGQKGGIMLIKCNEWSLERI